MKLFDLDPSWYVLEENGPVIGLSFKCPHCQEIRLGICFHHKGFEVIEDNYLKPKLPEGRFIWTLIGNDFSNLSIIPSIDASKSGHWHGFITNGEITNA